MIRYSEQRLVKTDNAAPLCRIREIQELISPRPIGSILFGRSCLQIAAMAPLVLPHNLSCFPLSSQIQWDYLNFGHDHFPILANSLFTDHYAIRRFTVWTTNSVSKWNTNKLSAMRVSSRSPNSESTNTYVRVGMSRCCMKSVSGRQKTERNLLLDWSGPKEWTGVFCCRRQRPLQTVAYGFVNLPGVQHERRWIARCYRITSLQFL